MTEPTPQDQSGMNTGHADVLPAKPVSTIVGDRLCTRCCYNLTGQTVLREPHYDLLIVRCPECSTAAAVQEYPLLGRWARRWGALLAAMWFAVVLLILLISVAVTCGITSGSAYEASQPFAELLEKKQTQWQQTQPSATGPQNTPVWMSSTRIDQKWASGQDIDQLLEEAGGFRQLVEWPLSIFIGFSLWGVSIGIVWSVVLLHMKRRWLVLTAVAIVGLAAAFYALEIWMSANGSPVWLIDIAKVKIGPLVAVVILSWAWVWLVIGMFIGRPVIRLLVKTLLPPRLRSSLAILWTANGLAPPKPQHPGTP